VSDHRLPSLAAVALLVLAGCSVGPVGSDRAGVETPTLTPAPVPDEGRQAAVGSDGARATVGGRRLAPGLRTGGVADAFALAGAHRAVLANRSYTRIDSRTVVDGNGTLRATRQELRVAAAGVPFRLHRSAVSADRYDVVSGYSDITIYHDGERAYYRLVGDGNTSYGVDTGASPGEVEADRTGQEELLGLLTSFEWEVQRVEIGGEPRYRLTSTRLVAPATLDDAFLLTDPRDAEIRMLVGSEGRVYRYRAEYDTTYDGRTVGVTETVRWSDVGTTDDIEPSWLDRARNASRDAGQNAVRAGTLVG
jgi:hypothetical protein